MTPDSVAEPIREYLREHFGKFQEEPHQPDRDSFVFSILNDSGQRHFLTVNMHFFTFPSVVEQILATDEIARKLSEGDHIITRPMGGSTPLKHYPQSGED